MPVGRTGDEPLELVVDADGRVSFASAAARRLLAQPGVVEAIAARVQAVAATSAPGPVTIDNVRITRLDGDPASTFFLVNIGPPSSSFTALTPMQLRVAERAALGMTVAEVAHELAITAHTVRSHLKEIYRRLHVANRVELANALRDAKLVDR